MSQPPAVAGEVLVGFDASAPAEARAAARRSVNARVKDVVADDVELLSLPANTDRRAAQARLRSQRGVRYAEPNWIYTHGATSVDPSFVAGSMWGLYGDASSPSNAFGSQAAEAWAGGNTGGETLVVGVIDTGVDVGHPDLDANVWRNPREIAANGVDDDGNGYVDDVEGWDFHNNDATVFDGLDDDHGTHVAGTIGAEANNGVGVVGMAWDVRLAVGKFLGPNGGYTSNAVKAVDYFVALKAAGVNIVALNNSWGGGGYSSALAAAIERANTAGILFIAAAGNGGSDGRGDNNDSVPHYPSSYANSNVISVASITSTGARSAFSNYGASSVDLGAPGSSVLSTLPGGTYGSYSGTSMATPHVTGAAVLHRAVNPTATAAATKSAILGTVVPTSSLAGITVAGGRLNASAFVSTTTPPETEVPPPPSDITLSARGYKVKGSQRVDLTWNGGSGTVTVYRNGANVADTQNDGFHTDVIGKGAAGTYSYKVCLVATTTCSNTAVVTVG